MSRTDCHRPSAIDPADYDFVGVEFSPQEKDGDIGTLMMAAQERERIRNHMAATGGTYSRHQHGGNCHVCGAHCIYSTLWHHRPTNTYIRMGFDCTDKMDMGDPDTFRAAQRTRDAIAGQRKSALMNKAGRLKARALLEGAGLLRAWELAELDEDPTDEPPRKCNCGSLYGCERCGHSGYFGNSWQTICDLVSKLIRYGDLRHKDWLRNLIDRVDGWEAEKQRRAAEKAAAEDVPEGRHVITGTILKKEYRDSAYGGSLKLTIKDDRGFIVWGTCPDSISLIEYAVSDEGDTWMQQRSIERGDRVTLKATITPSDRDSKFGFYKRPSNAEVLELNDGAEIWTAERAKEAGVPF